MPSRIIKKYGLRSLGVILFLYIVTSSDWTAIFAQFEKVSVSNIFLILLICLPGISLKAFRWHCLLRIQHIEFSFMRTWIVYAYAIGIGFLSPGRLGEFSKVLLIKNENNISFSKSLVSVFAERVIDMIILFWIFLIGFLFYVKGLSALTSFVAALLFIVIGILGFVIFFLISRTYFKPIYHYMERAIKMIALGKTATSAVSVFVNELIGIIQFKLSYVILLSLISAIIQFFQFMLFAHQLNLDIDIFQTGFALTIVGVSSMLPISFMGIGTREAVLIFTFGLYGLTRSDAMSYSLLIFSLQLITNLIIVGLLTPFISIKCNQME